jgi:hypothetical protein
MTYQELDINSRINLKGVLKEWAMYATEHFQEQLSKKVYGLRSARSGVQRSSLAGYRFGSRAGRAAGSSRSNALRNTWYQNVQSAATGERVLIEFLLYGRFIDMGVGRGTTDTSRKVDRQLRIGSSTKRRRIAWYSKRKSHEVKTLNELLAKRHVRVAMDAVETALNISVTRNL